MSANTSEVLVNESSVTLEGEDTSNNEGGISRPFDPLKVRVETKNTQMDALIKRIRNKEIELSPDFQRRSDVWRDDRQSRLIESMLIKIPLQAFYVDATNDENWLVIDGLQRLNTIRRFVISGELALKNMEFLKELENKKFDQLPRSLQRRIEETDIVVHQIKEGTPDDVKYIIFRRINTGGEPLKPQEIRHALNQGPVVKLLAKLAGSKEFKQATDDGVSPRRMDDQECVLRFLAFTVTPPDNYTAEDFDMFLNKAMQAGNDLSEKDMSAYEEIFLRAMTTARKIFGHNAFRKIYKKRSGRFPVNKALFETVAVNLGRLSHEEQEILIKHRADVVKKFMQLIAEDYEFESSVSQGTGSVKKVRYRFEAVRKLFAEVLNADRN